MSAWIADALLLLGLAIMTIAIFGVVRLPDVFSQLHAASKAAFLGVVALLAAATLTGDGGIITRAVLIAVLLSLTTPVSSHAIAQAAFHRGESLDDEDSRDRRESVF